MLRSTSLNWQEPVAYAASALALALGIYYGYMRDADWLGRSAPVIIVCGVLLASSRKIDLLHQKVTAFFDNYRAKNSTLVRDELAGILGRTPLDEETESMEKAIYASAKSDTKKLIEERRRVFRTHEIVLVSIGTLTNGFGSWLVKLAQSLA